MTAHRGEHRARGTATTPMDYIGKHRPEVIAERTARREEIDRLLLMAAPMIPDEAWVYETPDTRVTDQEETP